MQCPTSGTVLSIEDSRELLSLCKAGKLYQIEDWIKSGRSISVHPKSRDSPLHIAVRTGFHSLLELLARNCETTEELNEVLIQAVRRQQFDMARMLVEVGADPLSVPFPDVICAWDPEMMRYFMGKGCDVFADDALARALSYRIRTALGFYMDYKRQHPERREDLQVQLDTALALHCREGDEKWVSMLMWADGNPHAKVRDLERKNHDHITKPWYLISGAEEAARKGHTKILELLKLNPAHEDAQNLLYEACSGIHVSAVHYLLKIGISPNDKEDGGSSGLDAILFQIDWGKRCLYKHSSTADNCLKIAKDLIQHRAKWTPDAHNLRGARRAVCQVEPKYASQLVGLLKRPRVCDPEILAKFTGAAKMQEMLKL